MPVPAGGHSEGLGGQRVDPAGRPARPGAGHRQLQPRVRRGVRRHPAGGQRRRMPRRPVHAGRRGVELLRRLRHRGLPGRALRQRRGRLARHRRLRALLIGDAGRRRLLPARHLGQVPRQVRLHRDQVHLRCVALEKRIQQLQRHHVHPRGEPAVPHGSVWSRDRGLGRPSPEHGSRDRYLRVRPQQPGGFLASVRQLGPGVRSRACADPQQQASQLLPFQPDVDHFESRPLRYLRHLHCDERGRMDSQRLSHFRQGRRNSRTA